MVKMATNNKTYSFIEFGWSWVLFFKKQSRLLVLWSTELWYHVDSTFFSDVDVSQDISAFQIAGFDVLSMTYLNRGSTFAPDDITALP